MTTELQTTEQNQELTDILKISPNALNENKSSLALIKSKREALLARADKYRTYLKDNNYEKLTSEEQAAMIGKVGKLNTDVNAFIIEAKNAEKIAKEKRFPITKFFDNYKTLYTKVESEILAEVEPAQQFFNEIAIITRKLEERKQKESSEKLARTNEELRVKTEAEIQLMKSFNSYLTGVQSEMGFAFNALTVFPDNTDNLEEKKEEINKYSVHFTSDLLQHINCKINSGILSTKEVEEIVYAIKDKLFKDKFTGLFRSTITDKKAELIGLLPGKLQELQAIKKSQDEAAEKRRLAELEQNEAKKKKLEAEAKAKEEQAKKAQEEEAQRAEEARKELEQKEIASNEAATLTASTNQAAAKVNNLFDSEVETASVAPVSAGKIKEKMQIKLLHPSAILLIVSRWYEIEGSKLSIEALEKKFSTMITAIEKDFAKTDTRIESKYVQYVPVITASAKK